MHQNLVPFFSKALKNKEDKETNLVKLGFFFFYCQINTENHSSGNNYTPVIQQLLCAPFPVRKEKKCWYEKFKHSSS